MQVSDLMIHEPVTCSPYDTINRAAQLLWEHDVGCLPVIDGERRVVGMITDRDICMAAYTQGQPLWQIHVETCMSRQLVAVRAEDSIQLAASHMRERKVRRLPVVDDRGRLRGLLSLSDLARHMWPTHGAKAFDDDEILSVVASVSQPRLPLVELTPSIPIPPPVKVKDRKVSVSMRPVPKPNQRKR